MTDKTHPQLAGTQGRKPTKARAIDVAGLDGGLVGLTAEQLDELDSRVERPLLRAGAPGWDDAVLVWNGMVAKVPALVLQPTSAADVAVAVGLAREHGLSLSIKGGGHNMAGTSIAEGGLTLDMSRMRDVAVAPEARLAHVAAGCLLQDVDRATQAHGLATPMGSFSSCAVRSMTSPTAPFRFSARVSAPITSARSSSASGSGSCCFGGVFWVPK